MYRDKIVGMEADSFTMGWKSAIRPGMDEAGGKARLGGSAAWEDSSAAVFLSDGRGLCGMVLQICEVAWPAASGRDGVAGGGGASHGPGGEHQILRGSARSQQHSFSLGAVFQQAVNNPIPRGIGCWPTGWRF